MICFSCCIIFLNYISLVLIWYYFWSNRSLWHQQYHLPYSVHYIGKSNPPLVTQSHIDNIVWPNIYCGYHWCDHCYMLISMHYNNYSNPHWLHIATFTISFQQINLVVEFKSDHFLVWYCMNLLHRNMNTAICKLVPCESKISWIWIITSYHWS